MNNIYHLLNQNEGHVIKVRLKLAMSAYKKGLRFYEDYEEEALVSLETMFYTNLISKEEYEELKEQLYFLMRLYKGRKGKALGRKDVK